MIVFRVIHKLQHQNSEFRIMGSEGLGLGLGLGEGRNSELRGKSSCW